MSGLGEFGSLTGLSEIRAAINKIKTWSKGLNAGAIAFKKSDRLPYKNVQDAIEAESLLCTLVDGVEAPDALPGFALIFVDEADGDLKVRFGDGVTKTLATDT